MRLEREITVSGGQFSGNVKTVHVTLEVGDYTTPDGYHHVDGVYRVTARHTDGRPYRGRVYFGRRKTFKGETAWMDGERLFDDIVTEVQFAR